MEVAEQQIAVAELTLAADPRAWGAAGFDVTDGAATVGSVTLRFAGPDAGRRIVLCTLRGLAAGGELDGLPIARADAARAVPSGGEALAHPNGVGRIDHLVAFTPDLDRTVAAGEALGLDLRRVRDEPAPAGSPRQAFFRLGELILEIAQAPPGSPLGPDSRARFYGLAFRVDDLDATAAALGELCGEPRDAVQPGRRIATVRREAGLGMPVAFITPPPPS